MTVVLLLSSHDHLCPAFLNKPLTKYRVVLSHQPDFHTWKERKEAHDSGIVV